MSQSASLVTIGPRLKAPNTRNELPENVLNSLFISFSVLSESLTKSFGQSPPIIARDLPLIFRIIIGHQHKGDFIGLVPQNPLSLLSEELKGIPRARLIEENEALGTSNRLFFFSYFGRTLS